MTTRICVYMGARLGDSPMWGEAAEALGRAIAQRGWELVYGGSHVGLMGRCADAALAAGGRVTGVIPIAQMSHEVAHQGLTELIDVPDMHARKARMAELSDGFIALPGGIGTLEELFETWTWRYLHIHDKPIGLLNVNAFYTPLLAFLDHACNAGFMDLPTRQATKVESTPERLLDTLFD